MVPNATTTSSPVTPHPPPITEFPHIRRMRDSRFPYEIASILPGEFFVSREPMIIYTVLGSCISACIRDPAVGVGGMNHFMLPHPHPSRLPLRGKAGERSGEGCEGIWEESTRYGSFAMECLINEILKRGGMKHRLEIKLFGAGKIHDGNMDVGVHNAEWVLNYLHREGLSVTSSDLGDVYPRKVYYFTDSGRVLLKKIERIKNRTIHEREAAYAQRLQDEQAHPHGDVTLFQ